MTYEYTVWAIDENKEVFETTFITDLDLTREKVIEILEKRYTVQGWELMYVKLNNVA